MAEIDKKMVSVIIPVYNRREKVIRAVESIRNQTRFSDVLEVIVIDDGSTDGTSEAILEYSKKHPEVPIKLLQQKNGGPSTARNFGMSQASGYYIAFLDSDDEWLDDKLDIQLNLMDKYPQIDFLGGGVSSEPLKILWRIKPKLYQATLSDLLLKSFPVTPSIIFKREIFLSLGGFDETLTYYEDCDYLQQICRNGYGYFYYAEKVVICDNGKREFGVSGLSAQLDKVHKDCIKSLKKRRKEKCISLLFYLFLRFFYQIKHYRRTVITKCNLG